MPKDSSRHPATKTGLQQSAIAIEPGQWRSGRRVRQRRQESPNDRELRGDEPSPKEIKRIVTERAGLLNTVTYITNLGSRGLDYQIVQFMEEMQEAGVGGIKEKGFLGISTFFSPYLALYQQFGGRIGRPTMATDGTLAPTPGELKTFWNEGVKNRRI